MPTPIEIEAIAEAGSAMIDTGFDIDTLIETQADPEGEVYKVLAARRAQLEDAETLRRARAL